MLTYISHVLEGKTGRVVRKQVACGFPNMAIGPAGSVHYDSTYRHIESSQGSYHRWVEQNTFLDCKY
jgi:hypothetical protein